MVVDLLALNFDRSCESCRFASGTIDEALLSTQCPAQGRTSAFVYVVEMFLCEQLTMFAAYRDVGNLEEIKRGPTAETDEGTEETGVGAAGHFSTKSVQH